MEPRHKQTGLNSLSRPNRWALLLGGMACLSFPFFWPQNYWLNVAAGLVAGLVVYVITFFVLSRRK